MSTSGLAGLAPPVVVVLEGAARHGVDEGASDGVTIIHAPGHGDETLVGVAAAATEHVVLVSADQRWASVVVPSGRRSWGRAGCSTGSRS